ncbi:MAG: DNA methylase [Clostridiales bacterium]|nr:DNA methylase [Clostridiales bacterium]
MKNRTYIAIDFKSFYASVECIERNLDPLTTNLVVADVSRTEKTICLAVSPSLKAYGIPGRARLFEVVQKVREVNARRRQDAPGRAFSGASFDDMELKSSLELALDYIAATPRMALYIDYSTRIYNIYLKYIAPEDIHVYSIDEVFMDVTDYLSTYKMTARELASKIIQDVRRTTGIIAAAGIGTNLYLCKVAMDIQAKHIQEDKNGVLIAELDEISYRKLMWDHRPLTDFWRIGRGYAKKLEEQGLMTMGDIAKCSLGKADEYYNEDLLYRMFGINAELLIDHAWGWEPCTIADIKAYKPSTNCIGSGQVLPCAYPFDKARLVVREMTDMLALDLVDRGLATDQLVLAVGYDIDNLADSNKKNLYHGQITTDRYGRSVPKSAHGTINLEGATSSAKRMLDAITKLFEEIVDKNLLIRRVNISANHVVDESIIRNAVCFEQLNLFTDYAAEQAEKEKQDAELIREKKVQKAVLEIKHKYGKNAVLRGMNLEEGATSVLRNRQIGGHRA